MDSQNKQSSQSHNQEIVCSDKKKKLKIKSADCEQGKYGQKYFNKIKRNILIYILNYLNYYELLIVRNTNRKIRVITDGKFVDNPDFLSRTKYFDMLLECNKEDCDNKYHCTNLLEESIFKPEWEKCSFCILDYIICVLDTCRCGAKSCKNCNKISFCYNHDERMLCTLCGEKCKTCDNVICYKCRDNTHSVCVLCGEFYCYRCDDLFLKKIDHETTCIDCITDDNESIPDDN